MSSGAHRRDDSASSYYFVGHKAGTSATVRDAGDETAVVEVMPPGADHDNFAPRVVNMDSPNPTALRERPGAAPSYNEVNLPIGGGIFNRLFGGGAKSAGGRKKKTPVFDDFAGAKKVDPKIFFSIERTYLAWMHAAILLAGISVAISAYAEVGSASAIYGLMILPISIVFIIYAMLQYAKRSYMINIRSPGPYEDKWGPVVLGSIFIASLVAQFLVKLFTM